MVTARGIRRIVIEQSKRAHVGHIGSSLGIAELMAVLYGAVLRIGEPDEPDRDRFVLSKGHAALALYAALYQKGWLSKEELDSFCSDGTALGVHPEHRLKGVDFSTGSLGHGLSMGVGAALAARLSGSERRVLVLLSDAELNEGSLWEALMFAAQHKLSRLTAVVEVNGQQALGYTRDILDLDPLAARIEAFGWRSAEVDGNNDQELEKVLLNLPADGERPCCVLARTVFGKGVSFMERQIKWHYWPMSDSEYEQALHEVEAQ